MKQSLRGFAELLYLAAVVIYLATRRTRRGPPEADCGAVLREEARKAMARWDAGMPASHPETPGPAALPAAEAAFLGWLEDSLAEHGRQP